jgi:hypothetical protein
VGIDEFLRILFVFFEFILLTTVGAGMSIENFVSFLEGLPVET